MYLLSSCNFSFFFVCFCSSTTGLSFLCIIHEVDDIFFTQLRFFYLFSRRNIFGYMWRCCKMSAVLHNLGSSKTIIVKILFSRYSFSIWLLFSYASYKGNYLFFLSRYIFACEFCFLSRLSVVIDYSVVPFLPTVKFHPLCLTSLVADLLFFFYFI